MIINPYRFAPAGVTDPHWASVVALLHLNGSNGSTVITDVRGNSCSASGGAAISTAQFKFGGASLLLDGDNDHVTIGDPGSAFDLGSSNFTFDWWFRSSNVGITSVKPMWAWRNTGASNNAHLAMNLRQNALRLAISFNNSTDATTAAFGTGSMSISNNTWHFCRLTRSGSDFKLFIDGTQRGSTYTNATAFTNVSRECFLGRSGITYFPGHLDEFRATIGVARDGSEVPTAAFPDS